MTKISGALNKGDSGENGAEAKLQGVMNDWLVKADYSLELPGNLTWEEKRETINLRSKVGNIFLVKKT